MTSHIMADGETYWQSRGGAPALGSSRLVILLPAYDEYYLGYKNRGSVLDPDYDSSVVSSNGVFRPVILVDGQIVGTWKGKLKTRSVSITPSLFRPLAGDEEEGLLTASRRYGDYLGLAAELDV